MSQTNFDPHTILACALELAEATVDYRPADHAQLLDSQFDPCAEVSLEDQLRWQQAVDAIEESSNRLKRALGAEGPLDAGEARREKVQPIWKGFRSQFRTASSSSTICRAFWKLANAAVDLSGYARVRVQNPALRERGMRLLAQGIAQLWDGMGDERTRALKSLLARSNAALGWPRDLASDPPPYKGPKDIGSSDEYRVIDMSGGFATRTEDLSEEQQDALRADYQELLRRKPSGKVRGKQPAPRPTMVEVTPDGLTFEPGSFAYKGHRENLSGKPLQVLEALAGTRGKAMTLAALREKCWGINSECGEEAIRSAVKFARAALRRVISVAGVKCKRRFDPIPSADRGTGRTAWRLNLP